MTRRNFGARLGAAVAGIGASAAVSAAFAKDKVAKHVCKGMNDCKGQGFKDLTAKACSAAGGSLTPKAG